MSLKDFQTILTPQEKVGALAFYQKPTPGFPQGKILPATFSRPDVGATSGATVFDKDGVLQELAEDAPDWSFPIGGGCPRILMRTQAENLIQRSNDFNLSPWQSANMNLSGNAFGAPNGLNNEWEAEILNQSNNRVNTSVPVVPEAEYTFYFDVKRGTATDLYYAVFDQTNAAFIVPATSYYSQINSTEYTTVAVTFTTPVGCLSVNVYPNFTPSTTGTYYLRHAHVVAGSDTQGVIYTTGTALTRSANSIEWNNMQLAGVLGSDAGSWLIKLKDYKSWANVSTFLRLDGDGSDTLRLSARTADQLLLLFDAGLGTNSLGSAFNGQDAIISITYDTTWLRIFVGTSKHAEIEHGGSLSLDNLRTNIASAFAEIALMAFNPVFLSDAQMIAANTEAQNL